MNKKAKLYLFGIFICLLILTVVYSLSLTSSQEAQNNKKDFGLIKIVNATLSNDSYSKNPDGSASKTINGITLKQSPENIIASGTKIINGTEYSTGVAELRLNASQSYALKSTFNLSELEIDINTQNNISKYADAELFRIINFTNYRIIVTNDSNGALDNSTYPPYNLTHEIIEEQCTGKGKNEVCNNVTVNKTFWFYYHNESFEDFKEAPLDSYNLKSSEKHFIRFIFEKGLNDIYDVVFKFGIFNITLPAPTINSIYPWVQFISPTPPNNNNTNNTFIPINVSIMANATSSIKQITYNWNGTNYSFYDDTLKFMMNFDNLSSLGENATWFKDVGQVGDSLGCSNCPTIVNGLHHGKAVSFDGTNDILIGKTDDDVNYNISSDITISVWLKMGSTWDEGQIVGRNAHGSGWEQQFQFKTIVAFGSDNNLRYQITRPDGSSSGTQSTFSGTSGFSPNTLYHIVVTRSGTNTTFWRDGKPVYSGTVTGLGQWGDADYIYVGDSLDNERLNATIDDLMIWNRTLTGAEIKQLYRSQLYKINQSDWIFYTNQSKNSTHGLDNGDYNYSVFVKNSAGLSNITETRQICIGTGNCPSGSDTTAPTYSNITVNTTLNGTLAKFSVLLADNVAVSGYIFGTNNTGTWVNDSFQTTSNWANVTKTLNTTNHTLIGYRWWFNDTSANSNDTGIQQFYTTAPTPASDSCTCAGLNTNWQINMSHYCKIYTACDLGTGNITFVGTGNATFNATISAFSRTKAPSSSTLFKGGQLVLNIG